MIRFELIGSVDPILRADFERNDILYCESGAMVSMSESLSLTGKAKGGVFSAIGRKMLNDESFFQQKIEADRGVGFVMLSPTLAGDILLLDVDRDHHYVMADGCYLANTEGVTVGMGMQGIGKALFAGTGSGLKGFFTLKAGGRGTLIVSGFGSMKEIAVTPREPLLVDNGHLVAWSEELKYEVALNTGHTGFFGTMVESVTSGEGIVLKFSGEGKVIVCSRNRQAFLDWILRRVPKPTVS